VTTLIIPVPPFLLTVAPVVAVSAGWVAREGRLLLSPPTQVAQPALTLVSRIGGERP